MNAAARKSNLEEIISKVAGAKVELTIRGDKSFTFSTETVTPDLGEKIASYFGGLATVTVAHDDECGTFAYVEAA